MKKHSECSYCGRKFSVSVIRLGKRECPCCGRRVALDRAGRVRRHEIRGEGWSDVCPGTGEEVRP